ncbi:DUF421 domain-containing protein [Peribacillus alkalitolerans]|uniref:DUF421 domain-containing protein n=1 Tax=Peribacillus alkalitolerans TaxID=1550385 RepID=UPI0013D315D7|nr:DUF421 domain-containing protein [Peribacillus alkalitolerans]
MENILEAVFRSIASYIILILVTYFVGKNINSHKNYYSFAFSVTLGSFIANMGFNINIDFLTFLFSFTTVILMFYVSLLLSTRSQKLRKWLSGRPTILVEHGKILDENMKKIKFTVDDLTQRMRELGVFDINEVEFALLEASGELSILKRNEFKETTIKDFHFPLSKVPLPIELIMDGKIILKNLNSHYNLQWIQKECDKRNLKVEDIYYAVINSNGSLFVDTYSVTNR